MLQLNLSKCIADYNHNKKSYLVFQNQNTLLKMYFLRKHIRQIQRNINLQKKAHKQMYIQKILQNHSQIQILKSNKIKSKCIF